MPEPNVTHTQGNTHGLINLSKHDRQKTALDKDGVREKETVVVKYALFQLRA